MRSQTITAPKFLGIDVVRVRSTDSTEAVAPDTTKPEQKSPVFKRVVTPDRLHQSWRTKDQASIFRGTSMSPSSDVPGLFEIKRCLAFDEDDTEE